MPQMMPMNWIFLMIYFMMIFYSISNLNYFLMFYKNKPFKIKTLFFNKNWKW